MTVKKKGFRVLDKCMGNHLVSVNTYLLTLLYIYCRYVHIFVHFFSVYNNLLLFHNIHVILSKNAKTMPKYTVLCLFISLRSLLKALSLPLYASILELYWFCVWFNGARHVFCRKSYWIRRDVGESSFPARIKETVGAQGWVRKVEWWGVRMRTTAKGVLM